MTKSFNHLIKIDTSSTSLSQSINNNNNDEQKNFLRKDAEKFGRNNRKFSMNDTIRQSSHRFLQKLRNITFNSIVTKNETPKSNEKLNYTSKDDIIARQYSLEFDDKLKLKGILKSSRRNTLFSNSIDHTYNDQPNESHDQVNRIEILHDNDNKTINCTMINASKIIKQVRFKEKVFKKRYPPCESFPNVTKLSNRQQKNLEKLNRRDSLNLQSVPSNPIHSINSSEFQESDCSDSNEEEDLTGGDE